MQHYYSLVVEICCFGCANDIEKNVSKNYKSYVLMKCVIEILMK